MKVSLRILDGTLAGRVFEFELGEGTEVRIGRDPARCQLVLPPEYASVSRQHCVLRSVLGRVRLRINKENPVFVAEAQAWDDSVVRDGSQLRLGMDGPRLELRIRDAEDAGLRTTVLRTGLPPIEQIVQEEAHRTAEELRGHARRIWVAAAVLAGAAGVGLLFALEARAETGQLVAKALSEEQRRSVIDMVVRSTAPRPDLGASVRAAVPSVYCVIDVDETRARHVGTAWVLDRDQGWLATNSHVAEEFVAGRTFLRALGHESPDVPVASARLHPGYQRYTQLCTEYAEALMLGGGANSRTVVACDVALLQVDEERRAALAPPLPLLDAAEFASIAAGRPCASIGFPAEGLAFNVERPQSRSHFGHVIATSDFFMAPAGAADALLLHTDLPVSGGASGSPVLDEHGRVFGMINAGSFTLGMEGRRIPIAGTTYAQRIDLLTELVRGDTAAQQARERTWEVAFEAMSENARKGLEQVLSERFRRSVSPDGSAVPVEVVVRERSQLVWDGALAKCELAFVAPSAGRYLFCAMSEDMQDIDAVALLPDGGQRVDNAADWYPCLVVTAAEGDEVQFIVLRNADKPVGATIFVLHAGV